jgi:general secretion pathway protein E
MPRQASGPSAEFLDRIPHEFARRHLVLSAGMANDTTTNAESLLVASTTPPWIVHNVAAILGREVQARIEPAESIAAAIDGAYAARERASALRASEDAGPTHDDVPRVRIEGSGDVEADLRDAMAQTESDLLSTSGKAPAVRLVDLILFEALLKNASDVHLQPTRGGTLVRYRLDGVLHTVRQLSPGAAASVASRIKVMSRLDVAEQRMPQDGRASVSIGGVGGVNGALGGRRVDLRISVLPSTYGERIVIRLLDPARSAYLLNFGALGMPPAMEREYLRLAGRASGIVLATGPTGSGKTTTLYTTLAWLSSSNAGSLARGCELNMMTIEDPVEYDLNSGSQSVGGGAGGGGGLAVSQTQVDPKKNVTFAAGLRHILRQDPDVIMVGEIRDAETARIAVQASLTGHLVLSTLHTSDAASAVARLIDLSVEPFLVASSLSGVLAQRLVRLLHEPCAGAGCEGEGGCSQTGYKGRTAVFELLVLDAELRELVTRRATAGEIKACAQAKGMVTLKEAGETLARAGQTTMEELARVIEGIDEHADSGGVA